MSVLVVVLVAAVVGAIAWYAYRSKQKRREALFVFATQHRMDYSREDTFDLPDAYGFACPAHSEVIAAGSRDRRQVCPTSPGESVGELGVYRYEEGALDSQLERVEA